MKISKFEAFINKDEHYFIEYDAYDRVFLIKNDYGDTIQVCCNIEDAEYYLDMLHDQMYCDDDVSVDVNAIKVNKSKPTKTTKKPKVEPIEPIEPEEDLGPTGNEFDEPSIPLHLQ